MKQRKLKKFVIPTIYVFAISAMFLSIILFGNAIKGLFKVEKVPQKVLNPIQNVAVPVMDTKNDTIIKPYANGDVKISKYFYSKDTDEETQKQSLIMYQNTYMQNSGILYTSTDVFDVVAVLDGKVANIKTDDILGTIIEVEHSANLTTIYYSLGEVKVEVGSEIKQGDVIATSGVNNLSATNTNSLLFEVIHNGILINPEEFYIMNIEDL